MRTLPVVAAFSHALSSTFNNLGFAFHASWPWMLGMLLAQLGGNLYLAANGLLEPDPYNPDGRFFAVIFLVGAYSVLAFSSIAVSWHRYILRDEVPRGWQRLRLDATVWSYIGNAIMCFLSMFVVLLVAAFPVAILGVLLGLAGNESAADLLATGYALTAIPAAMVILYRLSVKLPAVALERRDFLFRDAWRVTAGNNWRFLGLILLIVAPMFIVGAATTIVGKLFETMLGTAGLAISTTVYVAVNWGTTILGVTLLTSLYGFFVEERDF